MTERDTCPAEAELRELTGSVKVLVQKVDNLIALNRDIIKWLLIVVCIIALGRSAFDLSRDLFEHVAEPLKAEVLNGEQ